jgi:hypothetical protein
VNTTTILTRLSRAGIETEDYTQHELRATALDYPLLFTEVELINLRAAYDAAELDLGHIVFVHSTGGAGSNPPRSYQSRALRTVWIPQLSARIAFVCDDHAGVSADVVFEAWRARFMPGLSRQLAKAQS